MTDINKITKPTTLIIVGISGDLAKRKLLPAIREIAAAGVLPDTFRIIGVTRRDLRLEDVLPEDDKEFLRAKMELYQMDLTDLSAYRSLAVHLNEVERSFSTKAQRLFYLSIPPQASQSVVELLGESGLADIPDTKLLLEKPFGTDLASAENLVSRLKAHFKEEQVYRIDHFMAKEMAQNLVVFRASNSLFKRTWNNEFIERIDIIAPETIGIEGRADFYEQTGALRDIIQSHLLQLAALTLMELPAPDDWQSIPAKRLQALQSIQPPSDISKQVKRGQYAGYREEVQNPGSSVETFVFLTVFSEDSRWQNVPITLMTGKALDKTTTEIRIKYRQEDTYEANELVLRIQPNEGVEFDLWVKKPGFDWELRKLPLEFTYKQHFDDLPEAYERVFVDAMRSDHRLFTTSEEVLASWHILEPIQQAWRVSNNNDLLIYEKGSSGPAAARD